MKLSEIILLSLSVGFLIIGIHQIMTVGFVNGYWAVMIALILLFVFNYRRRKQQQ